MAADAYSAGAAPASAFEPPWRDPGGWRLRLSHAMIAHYRASGDWSGVTIGERLDRLAVSDPDHVVIVDGVRAVSAAALRDEARRLAAALAARGLAPGDVVSFQLPNWHEAVIVELACAYGGFVCQPIVPIFRAHDVSYMLADAGSRFLFVPESFRGFDYPAMIAGIRDACPRLTGVATVRGRPGPTTLEEMIASSGEISLPPPDPDRVKLILYTSGTTSRPKGVLHTHNTIDAEVRNFARHLGLGEDDVVLMPSTLCHITGYLYGIQLPITLGARAVLMESWEPAAAAELIDRHDITFTIGATPFIQELAAHASRTGATLPSLRYFPTGGAPVPPSVIELAESAFARCCSFRVYGSTEAPTVSLGAIDDPDVAARATTEGVAVGHEVKLVGDDGREVPAGASGEVAVRGPEVCVGYARWEQTVAAFDAEGYFRTGDLAHWTPERRLVIGGRKKDIIIRGGENISPKEIEDVLGTHPDVGAIAVVAMPHPRLGETGCAFAAPSAPGRALNLKSLKSLLAERGVAKHKWPEKLILLEALPYTAAGKIKKEELRNLARAAYGAENEA